MKETYTPFQKKKKAGKIGFLDLQKVHDSERVDVAGRYQNGMLPHIHMVEK